MSWITAILQLYSQVADLFGNVIVKRIDITLFDLLARFHYILNLPRRSQFGTHFESLFMDNVLRSKGMLNMDFALAREVIHDHKLSIYAIFLT